jgi:hypothetical protein
MFQGPVVTSIRVTGLAGATVALAEGVDGTYQNPAAPAVRTPWSRDNFDYDLGVGLTFPSTLRHTDFFNRGENTNLPSAAAQSFTGISLALVLQWGEWGVGVSADVQRFALENTDRTRDVEQGPLSATFAIGHLPQIARMFADGQLAVGLGLRSTGLTMSRPARDLFVAQGTGYEAGLLWRPNDQPFRLGAAFRSAISATPNYSNDGDVSSDGLSSWIRYDPDGAGDQPAQLLFLPSQVTLPWDFNVGLAIQLGRRPFNPRWFDPEQLVDKTRRFLRWRERQRTRERSRRLTAARRRGADLRAAAAAIDAEHDTERALDELHEERAERRVDNYLRQRYASMSRWYLLVSTSMVFTGPVTRGVGVEGFLQQREHRSGEKIVLSPRIGIESEIVPNWLKLRGGSYVEPTRFETGTARLHGTLGFEQKLFPWTVFGIFEQNTSWRISGVVDVAQRYFGWGASIGVWR